MGRLVGIATSPTYKLLGTPVDTNDHTLSIRAWANALTLRKEPLWGSS
jgi:hypothetical protein